MQVFPRRSLVAPIALAALTACYAGCSAGPGPSPTQQSRQRDTAVTPLWATQFAEPPPPPGPNPYAVESLTVTAADVNDAGSTYAFAKVHTRNPDFQSNALYVFDPSGAFSGRSIRMGNTQEGVAVRVNAAGPACEISGGISPPGVGIYRGDQQVFRRTGLGSALDVCADGSTVFVFRDWSPSSAGSVLIDIDASGAQQWSVSLPSNLRYVYKLRCLGDGRIVAAGLLEACGQCDHMATAAQYESDGTLDWTWTGSDPATLPVSFDVDGDGNVYVGANAAVPAPPAPNEPTSASGQFAVYALDRGGALLAAWKSTGTSDFFQSITVSDVVAVAGGGHAAVYDRAGNLLWRRDDVVGDRIALDGADDLFVCGKTSTALYGADGTTQWTYDSSWLPAPIRADATAGVARCIGTAGNGIGIVAFQVR